MGALATRSVVAADPDNGTEWQLTMLKSAFSGPTADRYGVVFAHGASLTTAATDPAFAVQATQCPAWYALGADGYSCISRNFAGNNWGSDAAVTRMGQAYTWHQSNGSKAGKIAIVGFSMGACQALNYASRNNANVACLLLICPVLSLITVHDNNLGGYQASIETAYGGTAAYNAAAAAHDPLTFAANLTVPTRIYNSTDDAFCTPAQVATFTGASGGHVESASMGASGHTMSPVPPAEALTFIHTYT